MRYLAFSLSLLLFLSGCSSLSVLVPQKPVANASELLKLSSHPSWEKLVTLSCSRNFVDGLKQKANANGEAALHTAYCLTRLIETENSSAQRLADAKHGQQIAENIAQQNPDNAIAHYLLALLTAQVADNDKLHGLTLVPTIEAAAKKAAQIDASIDAGGPERVLGELYLNAPEPPISIGDSEVAVNHFKRAVTLAPLSLENQLGLAEALVADDEPEAACKETQLLFSKFPAPVPNKSIWEKGLKLLDRLCKLQK